MPYRTLLGRYQQTAHSAALVSESVIITNPIHPLHGQSVKVLSLRRLGKSVRVILEHPDGGILSLPASETSWEITSPPPVVKGQTPLLDPKKLLHLSQWVETLSRSQFPTGSDCQQYQKVSNQNSNGETATTQESPSLSFRRANETVNPPDRAVSEQNARPTSASQQEGENR